MYTKKFLKEEIQKPVDALRFTALFSIKFLALLLLRVLLWCFFFVAPVYLFLTTGFHFATDKVRQSSEKRQSVQAPVLSERSQEPKPYWSLRRLSYDLRFWKREIEKWGS